MLPCIETYQKVDLRTITLGVPPQEVPTISICGGGTLRHGLSAPGADEGQRDGVCGRGGLLQSQQRHRERRQRGERSPQHQVMTLHDITLRDIT